MTLRAVWNSVNPIEMSAAAAVPILKFDMLNIEQGGSLDRTVSILGSAKNIAECKNSRGQSVWSLSLDWRPGRTANGVYEAHSGATFDPDRAHLVTVLRRGQPDGVSHAGVEWSGRAAKLRCEATKSAAASR